MKKVLLVTAGIFHPTYLGRTALHRSLKHMEGFSFDSVLSLEKLPPDLQPFSALVLHYHHKTLSQRALARLKEYVTNGGGILALHAATASFKETPPYFEILGGRFAGHGRVEKIEIRRIRQEIFQAVGDFSVRDELYIHELQPGVEVHFTATRAGREVPVVWTYRYGKGKVCYAAPGHTTATMKNLAYLQLLQRALRWVVE